MANDRGFKELNEELQSYTMDEKIEKKLKVEREFTSTINDIEKKKAYFEKEVDKYTMKNQKCKNIGHAIITAEIAGSLTGLTTGAVISLTGFGTILAVPIVSLGLALGGTLVLTTGYLLDKKRRRYARVLTLAKIFKAEFDKLYQEAMVDKSIDEKEYKILSKKYDLYKTEKKKLCSSTDIKIEDIVSYAESFPHDMKQQILEILNTLPKSTSSISSKK